jgi:hypothetical protein
MAMSTHHDIYNPPPAPVPYTPPPAEPIIWTRGDLLALGMLAFPVYLAAAWAWRIDPTLGLWVTAAGLFMILESWLSAVTFLHRHPDARRLAPRRRWMIFLVALLPWLMCLVFGAALMLGLFTLSDRLTGP